MTDNSQIDQIAELRRLQLELTEMDDSLTNNSQLPDSRGSLNTELLRELQAFRKENAEFKKAQGEINRSIFEKLEAIQRENAEFRKTQGTINRAILADIGAIRMDVTDLKIKSNQNDLVIRPLLKHSASISRNSSVNENQPSERTIVEEIIGTWETVENNYNNNIYIKGQKYKKFTLCDDFIMESSSDTLTSFNSEWKIDYSRCLFNNTLHQGIRQLYIRNSKLYIHSHYGETEVHERVSE